jgi:hypothetical protein
MCDLTYVNLLRVRLQEAYEKHIAAFGTTPHGRFTPWIMASTGELFPLVRVGGC